MKYCLKHPKYKGNKKPKSQCKYCLEIYFKLNQRKPIAPPTKIFKDKSKYNRKRKYKIDEL